MQLSTQQSPKSTVDEHINIGVSDGFREGIEGKFVDSPAVLISLAELRTGLYVMQPLMGYYSVVIKAVMYPPSEPEQAIQLTPDAEEERLMHLFNVFGRPDVNLASAQLPESTLTSGSIINCRAFEISPEL